MPETTRSQGCVALYAIKSVVVAYIHTKPHTPLFICLSPTAVCGYVHVLPEIRQTFKFPSAPSTSSSPSTSNPTAQQKMSYNSAVEMFRRLTFGASPVIVFLTIVSGSGCSLSPLLLTINPFSPPANCTLNPTCGLILSRTDIDSTSCYRSILLVQTNAPSFLLSW